MNGFLQQKILVVLIVLGLEMVSQTGAQLFSNLHMSTRKQSGGTFDHTFINTEKPQSTPDFTNYVTLFLKVNNILSYKYMPL